MIRTLGLIVTPVILFFVLLFLFVRFGGPIPLSVNSVSTTKSDVFSVTGEGKVSVTPDLGVISLGVQSNGATVTAARNTLNGNINKVNTAIKGLGIEDKDIRTENYNISPVIDFQNNQQRITGYTANTNIRINVRDLTKVNNVIDTATSSGANQVGGISFEVEDPSSAENEAREKAVAEAKRKASDAARIAGFSLGKIINYSEGLNGSQPPQPLSLRAADVKEAVGNASDVQPGSNEVIVTVTLSYQVN